VFVGVLVGVNVGTGVSVAVAVAVGVSVGLDVAVGVFVDVGLGVCVAVLVDVAVAVGGTCMVASPQATASPSDATRFSTAPFRLSTAGARSTINTAAASAYSAM